MTPKSQLPQVIKDFLDSKQFTVKDDLSNGRYFLVRVSAPQTKDDILIKINKSKHGSLRQLNHVLWTKSLAAHVPKNAPFHIAPIIDYGNLAGNYYWFTTPFVQGTAFSSVDKEYVNKITIAKPEKTFRNVIALMKYIAKADAQNASALDGRFGTLFKRKDKLTLLQTAISWARNDTPYLAELLQILQANYTYLGMTNAHGDFSDTNLIINAKNEPILIDAEISSTSHYKYYDVVEFYNRLFTRACAPELAQKFLTAYLTTLPRRSQQKFLNNFLCLSALRCIGNFMEIGDLPQSAGKQKRVDYATRYAEAIVSYKIIPNYTRTN